MKKAMHDGSSGAACRLAGPPKHPINPVKDAAILKAKLLLLVIFVIIVRIFSAWQQLADDHGLIDVTQAPKRLKQLI